VYVRGPNDNNDMIKVDGTKLGLNISDLSENVEYMFAIQAVNNGGDGNMTSYRSGIFCLPSKTCIANALLYNYMDNTYVYIIVNYTLDKVFSHLSL